MIWYVRRCGLYALVAACSFHTVAPATGKDGAVDAPSDAPPGAHLDAPRDAATAACPAEYSPIGALAHKYRHVATAAAWLNAEQACESDGAGIHLVVYDETGEQTMVDTITAASIWIGESDRKTTGTWLWVTGASATSLGSDSGKQCGEYYNGNGMGETMPPAVQQQTCTDTHSYVCECDMIAADPAAF